MSIVYFFFIKTLSSTTRNENGHFYPKYGSKLWSRKKLRRRLSNAYGRAPYPPIIFFSNNFFGKMNRGQTDLPYLLVEFCSM